MVAIETDHTLSVVAVGLSFLTGAFLFGEGLLLYAGLAMISALAFIVYAKSLEDFIVIEGESCKKL